MLALQSKAHKGQISISEQDYTPAKSQVKHIAYFENYIAFKSTLKKIFNREIDLVEEQTLKNPILINSINRNKELVYG